MTLEEKLNEFKVESIAEGKKKTRIEIARNLLLIGKLTNSEIANFTQLSLEEIGKITQELKNSTENTK